MAEASSANTQSKDRGTSRQAEAPASLCTAHQRQVTYNNTTSFAALESNEPVKYLQTEGSTACTRSPSMLAERRSGRRRKQVTLTIQALQVGHATRRFS